MSQPTPTIVTVATAVPPHRHNQIELHDRWLSPFIKSHRAKAIFAASEIESRYSSLASTDFLADEPTTKARNDLYLKTARPLAQQLIKQILTQANLTPPQITHFILTSCTGIDTPSLEAQLAGDLGMSPYLRRSALIGMGCHAGLTALDRAMVEVQTRPKSIVLLLAVELCMLHFQHGKKLDDMIAGAIFADGLGAAIVASQTQFKSISNRALPQLRHTMSYNDYSVQDLMGVALADTGFRIRLSAKVAKYLRGIIADVVTQFLAEVALTPSQIKFWGIHPGGAKIIDYIGQSLKLTETDLQYSRQVLRRYGNMSSATIFFVLEAIIPHGKPGDYALLITFGPGLTIELVLLQF